jgi:hypothetical protein
VQYYAEAHEVALAIAAQKKFRSLKEAMAELPRILLEDHRKVVAESTIKT